MILDSLGDIVQTARAGRTEEVVVHMNVRGVNHHTAGVEAGNSIGTGDGEVVDLNPIARNLDVRGSQWPEPRSSHSDALDRGSSAVGAGQFKAVFADHQILGVGPRRDLDRAADRSYIDPVLDEGATAEHIDHGALTRENLARTKDNWSSEIDRQR